MRYSTETKYKRYVKGYRFLSFARRFGDRYGKKLMDAATKTEIDTAKTASKRVVQKTAEATGDLTGNKIANKITSLSKTKSKEKEGQRQEIYIPTEKTHKIIDDLMEYQKITSLLGTTSDNYLDIVLKNGQKFMISRVMLKIDTNRANK